LCSRYLRLFQVASEPGCLVSQAYQQGRWDISFRRTFGPAEQASWLALQVELQAFAPSEDQDSVSWHLEPSGQFSIGSLYKKLIHGASVAHAKDVWKIACPLKVCILIRQMARDRLPSNAQIKRRHGQSDGNCAICHQLEDASHIFFNCPLAQFAWSSIRELVGVDW
jgi:hypothetical protein